MDDTQLLRYSRHILLNELGVEGQERIMQARVLLIGLGGLGSPAALYLATAGVGHLTLVDDDTVDLTNLQRQIAHTQDRLGQPKVESARQALLAINPELHITALDERVDAARLDTLVADADVVLDCSDNFATRQALNAACVHHGVPLVSGAAIRFDGQLAVYDSRRTESPCYACVFPPNTAFEEARCATMGVFAPLVGIIGSMQAAEALKLLSGAGEPAVGRLLMLDGRNMTWSDIRLPRNPMCPVCRTAHP
ncbi:HesA/MoeB/ThiF family protein [Candidatus Aalborgicola defluviihabitans]|jgi:molybdopterin/thiamine biosynthesis adenylyltransferase|uniref:HesA/MoeB/ThiF family protein n=1 Tax=Candidatus Aalborgicola defluviihabitans TaxID=3386187 RepID=UPI001DADD87C|nr:molybdopterin-synthase adenylyltransferase MoeB [Burkholderiales bacterium]MBK7280787.1 molybdopterin-synthase adenylyltransferase MoeB [Burkholderiales bacterium]MBL0243933.1 molybdopterin-synthase adenylyltransferase MoeB [Rhodoferax sp.]